MLSWIVGYRNPCDEELKTEDKTEEVKTEEVKEEVKQFKDYEEEINKLKEELRQLKIQTDNKWKARLSPVSDTELNTRKKRKKNKNASGT